MASDRFYFWRGYYDSMTMLDFESRGRLVTAMCEWAFEGREPDFGDNSVLGVVWPILRDQISSSVEIGRKQSERGKVGGRKSGEARKQRSKTTKRSSASSTASNSASSDMNGLERTGHEMSKSLSGTTAENGGVPSGTVPLDCELPPLTYE